LRGGLFAMAMPRGSGKALALDTPLPTPLGWTTMGDVRVGDVLFDERGRPCRVVFATEVQLGRPCYRVTFSDRESTVCGAQSKGNFVPEFQQSLIPYRRRLVECNLHWLIPSCQIDHFFRHASSVIYVPRRKSPILPGA